MNAYFKTSMAPISKVTTYEYSHGIVKYAGDYWIISRTVPLTPCKLAIIHGIIYELLERQRAFNILGNI